MHGSVVFTATLFAALAVASAPRLEAQAQGRSGGTRAPTPPAPEVGAMAPDFTLPWADAAGPRAAPLKLSDLKGKVVVLAFYPGDRTSGCTIEMHKFRDEYDKIFGTGKDVVVLPISKDGIASHASWAKDDNFPFALVSDTAMTIADKYGSHRPGSSSANRTIFVIGKDGKIAYESIPFGALDEGGYTTLAEEVAKASKM
jgi:thioredoxin-dependent peroxiredoxin